MMNTQDQTNPKKLFVGNLPYSATEQQLSELFSQFGTIVELKLIIDRMTGRSKGIAFVEFSSEAEATAAIEGTNGRDMDGRAMIVNVARPFSPKPRTGGFGGGDRGPRRDFGGRSNDRGYGGR
jgi:RNA recognition motif-containing protein